MDRVLRSYAHTAWTPADPLADLEPEVRRAILLMPSTFRERWKLAPWTDRHQRRLAIADIVAERRLMYELTHSTLEKTASKPVPSSPGYAADHTEPSSPYYRYRMGLHREAVASVRAVRSEQDLDDIARLPEAKADFERRDARRRALLALDIERTKLDIREMEILGGDEAPRTKPIRSTPSRRRKADKSR